MEGSTAGAGLPEAMRCAVLGNSIDAFCLQSVFAVALALARAGVVRAPGIIAATTHTLDPLPERALERHYGTGYSMVAAQGYVLRHGLGVAGDGIPSPVAVSQRQRRTGLGYVDPAAGMVTAIRSEQDPGSGTGSGPTRSPASSLPLLGGEPRGDAGDTKGFQQREDLAAEVKWQAALQAAVEREEGRSMDIWADTAVLQLLRQGVYPADVTAAERRRMQKRARHYTCTGGSSVEEEEVLPTVVQRIMPDRSTQLVPKPEERRRLVAETHQRCGHFGIRRTHFLLAQQ